MSPDLNWSHSHSIDPSSVPTNEVLDTPLLAAARSGHAEVVALLLAHNADTSKISVEGDNVVHLSIKSNNMSLISLCLDATAASLLKKKNYKNMLPLDVAKSMPNARLAVSKIEKIMGIAQSIGAMEGGEEAAQLPTISTALRRTVQENRSQEEGGGEDEGEEAEEDEDDEESSEWETDSGGEELSEHDNNIDDVGGGKATPDSKFPHAMSVGAWHRSMQNEKQDNNTNKDKNTQEKVKVTIPLTAAEKFQPALMHLQIDNELSSLKVTLVHERQNSTNLQHKLSALRKQTGKLDSDLIVSESTNLRLRHERDECKKKLASFQGTDLATRTLQDLEKIEDELKAGMAAVAAEKERKIKDMLLVESDKRMCVICQESAKCVLLMPCRHLCLCKECSRRSELNKCPLCRQSVTQKIDVFA